jgi:hypothetical protein
LSNYLYKSVPITINVVSSNPAQARCTWCNIMEQELLTFPEHIFSPPVFSGVRVTRSIVLYVCLMFCRSLFVLLSFFFWLLYCLSFGYCIICLLARFTASDYPFGILDLRLLITPLVSQQTSKKVWRYQKG